MTTKRTILIIGILAVIGVAVFLVLGTKPQTGGTSDTGFSIRDYLPFGKNSENSSDTENTTTDQNADEYLFGNSEDINKPIPRLRKISNEPVAGAVVFNIGTTSVVRFVEKGTGNVYEVRSDNLNIQRLTNTTIPKIIRAFWLSNGSGFLAQTILAESEIVETNFIKLTKNTASSTNENLTPFGVVKSKLPTDIKEIAIKPDNTKIFYYIVNGSISNWFVSNPDGTSSSKVFSHPLAEWLPTWAGNIVIMQTKSSAYSANQVFSFDTTNKNLRKIGLGAVGLSANPNSDASLSLVSNGGNGLNLFVVDNKSLTSDNLGISTFAEKCVWTKDKNYKVICAVPNFLPSGNYPDDWYQGLFSTQDSIIKINPISGVNQNVANLSSLSEDSIDVVDMKISPDQNYLIFKNKSDGFLWMFKVEE